MRTSYSKCSPATPTNRAFSVRSGLLLRSPTAGPPPTPARYSGERGRCFNSYVPMPFRYGYALRESGTPGTRSNLRYFQSTTRSNAISTTTSSTCRRLPPREPHDFPEDFTDLLRTCGALDAFPRLATKIGVARDRSVRLGTCEGEVKGTAIGDDSAAHPSVDGPRTTSGAPGSRCHHAPTAAAVGRARAGQPPTPTRRLLPMARSPTRECSSAPASVTIQNRRKFFAAGQERSRRHNETNPVPGKLAEGTEPR